MREGVPLKRMLKVVALVAVLAIVAAACDSDSGDTTRIGDTQQRPVDLSGGTLKMAMLADVTAAFDPQKEYYCVTWEYYAVLLAPHAHDLQGRTDGAGWRGDLPGPGCRRA